MPCWRPNSQLRWAVAALGSRLHWTAQSVLLSDAGSRQHLYGLVFADRWPPASGLIRRGRTTWRRTRRATCCSGVPCWTGRATSYAGVVHLRPVAQQTSAYQSTHSLLLSENARADALPILEIEADDVRCKHGSTTGRWTTSKSFI